MKIVKKINYVQILIHFMATLFLIISFNKFSFLNNVKILQATVQYGIKYTFDHHEKLGISLEDISLFSFWPAVFSTIALFVGFIISLIVSKVKGWSLINSIIVFLSVLILQRFVVSTTAFPSFSLMEFLSDFRLDFILFGSFFLILSSILFFSKGLNNIIQKQYLKQVNA